MICLALLTACAPAGKLGVYRMEGIEILQWDCEHLTDSSPWAEPFEVEVDAMAWKEGETVRIFVAPDSPRHRGKGEIGAAGFELERTTYWTDAGSYFAWVYSVAHEAEIVGPGELRWTWREWIQCEDVEEEPDGCARLSTIQSCAFARQGTAVWLREDWEVDDTDG